MISKHLRENLSFLRDISKLTESEIVERINQADRSLIYAICELCMNLVNEIIPCSRLLKFKLQNYEYTLIKLAEKKKLSKKCAIEKRLLTNSRGSGGRLLMLIIKPSLNYIHRNLLKRR